MASTTGNTLTRLPYEQRLHAVLYTNDEGTLGETRYPINYDELYNLKGRLLTLVDAMFADPEQRKAFKDLTWQALLAWMKDVENAATWSGIERVTGTTPQPEQNY